MYKVQIAVPEASFPGKAALTVSIEDVERTLRAPSEQEVTLLVANLTVKQSLLLSCEVPESPAARLTLCLGDFLPKLEGEVDQWFRLERDGSSGQDLAFRLVLKVKKTQLDLERETCPRCESSLMRAQALEMQLAALNSQLRVFPALQRELQTLQIDDLTLHYPASLSQQERDFFKFTLIAYHQRAKLTDSLQKEAFSAQQRLAEVFSQHTELRSIADETTVQLHNQLLRLTAEQTKWAQEKKSAWENVLQLRGELDQMRKNHREMSEKIRDFQQEIAVLRGREKRWNEGSSQGKEGKEELKAALGKNQELADAVKRLAEEAAATTAQFTAVHLRLVHEKGDLGAELQRCREQLTQKELLCDQLAGEKLKLESQNQQISCLSLLRDELTSTASAQESKIKALEQQNIVEISKIQVHCSDLETANEQLIRENATLVEENEHLKGEMQRFNRENVRLQGLYDTAKTENAGYIGRITVLEQGLCLQEDAYRTQEQLSLQASHHSALIQFLSSDLNAVSCSLLEQSEKALAGQQLIAKLTEVLERQSGELRLIRKMLHNPAPYVPVSSDPVDSALAQYLNSRLVPAPVPFSREEPGVYLFGSRKVAMKLENSRLIARVGGGFMSVEEFVTVYGPMELERLESRRQARPAEPLWQRITQCLEAKEACSPLTQRTEPSPRHRFN